MSLINVQSLGMTLGTPLFSNLDLTIARGDRLGIVAANGRGKSTLFACLAGSLEPTAGTITRARNLKIALMPQTVAADLMPRSLLTLPLVPNPV